MGITDVQGVKRMPTKQSEKLIVAIKNEFDFKQGWTKLFPAVRSIHTSNVLRKSALDVLER